MTGKQRIFVGMSGGVDSSVAASLLKKQGHEVIGVFMQNWEDDDSTYCSIKQDAIDAMSVADILGIDMEIVNFAKEYKERVFSSFLREYSAGRTPNPDVLCNAEIKFKTFLDYAISLGADSIATGHYARKLEKDGTHYLMKALDHTKDQSYFLCRLQQHQLSKTLFPLGAFKKIDVRKLAKEAGLPTAEKKDSTGLCFIGERPFREFLKRYIPTKPGAMIRPDGEVTGEHIGLMYYTLGQRKGLNIGGTRTGTGEPWFVAGKDIVGNKLIVVQGHDHPLLMKPSLQMADMSWTLQAAPRSGEYTAKNRYRMADAACHLSKMIDGQATLTFYQKQWAITPGQSAVLYDGDICLGGGIIQ